MRITVTNTSGNGDYTATSPDVTQEEATAQLQTLRDALASGGVAYLPWGAFRSERIVDFHLVTPE